MRTAFVLAALATIGANGADVAPRCMESCFNTCVLDNCACISDCKDESSCTDAEKLQIHYLQASCDKGLITASTNLEFVDAADTPECQLETDRQAVAEGGVLVSYILASNDNGNYSTYVALNSLPCRVAGWTVSKNGVGPEFKNTVEGQGVYPVSAHIEGTSHRIELTTFPTAFTNPSDEKVMTMRWLPKLNCVNKGCVILEWTGGDDVTEIFDPQSGTDVLLYSPSTATGIVDAGNSCYCDDACTRFKDCCWDYQWTCQARVGSNMNLYSNANQYLRDLSNKRVSQIEAAN